MKVNFQRSNLKLKSIECDASPNFCDPFVCHLVPINRTGTKIISMCKLKEPVNAIFVMVVVEWKNSKNIYSTWFNETVSYCERINKGHMDIFGFGERLLYKLDKNMVKSCPIEARHKIIFND